MHKSSWGKFAGLFIVVALLLAGLGQIHEIVTDRQGQRRTAIDGVARSLAGAQTLLGPVAARSCVEEWDVKGEQGASTGRREFRQYALPATLSLDGSSTLEPRGRGPYMAQVFALKARLVAQWPDLQTLQPERQHPNSRLGCGPASLTLALSDARGIRKASLLVNGAVAPLLSGTLLRTYPRGVHTVLAVDTDLARPLAVQMDVEIVGTEQLAVVPIGGATQVRLGSNWPHPSFGGQFLPAERKLGAAGFDADWRVSSLASTAQQDLLQGKALCQDGSPLDAGGEAGARAAGCLETLDVAFIDPVNTYVLSDRAIKYSLLFVALTFVAVGLFEFMCALRVHPIQYLLVGAAISIFFLLLLSISEHLPFHLAYAAAAAACVLLLAFYASHMLHSWKRGLPFGAGVAVLYGLLYLLLQLEQTALMVGALALFVVLALVMALTRRVDWYARLRLPQADAAAGGASPATTGHAG